MERLRQGAKLNKSKDNDEDEDVVLGEESWSCDLPRQSYLQQPPEPSLAWERSSWGTLLQKTSCLMLLNCWIFELLYVSWDRYVRVARWCASGGVVGHWSWGRRVAVGSRKRVEGWRAQGLCSLAERASSAGIFQLKWIRWRQWKIEI